MIRYAVLLLNMLGLFIYQLFVSDGVTVKQVIPSHIKPGNEYTIELTVNKGAVGGFAKLQQELPEGFTATAVESKGASFSFSGNAVKFIWTSLPSESEFKIIYKIAVAIGAPNGEKVIAGKFFYVTDNVKQSVEVPESLLKISDGATVAIDDAANSTEPDVPVITKDETSTYKAEEPENVVEPSEDEVVKEDPITTIYNTSETETIKTPVSALTNTRQAISCTRKINDFGGNEYTVELQVKRGNTTGFGKLQENIPVGFVASSVLNYGASFSFADRKVKLVWVDFPTDEEFKVVYKLTGTPSVGASIDGILSYIENDETRKVSIASTSISTDKVPVQKTEIQQTTTINTDVNQDSPADNTLTKPIIPKAQTSVNYKVQICALRQTQVEVSYFENRFNLSNVNTEMHEGWTKYIIGGFNEYKLARDDRELVKNKGVIGPFVTAYNSGKRITVQEALMISSQQWYR